jgi:hypothetical protein
MKNRTSTWFALLGGAVWIYLLLRAIYVPPVHDEAATFFHYVNHGEWMPGKALFDANNHILNSLLSYFFVKLFGIHAWSLRLANLLFFPLYCAALWGISRCLQHPFTRWSLLMGGVAMHGITEYFAYSRGYGMSMGLLTAALYFGIRFMRQGKTTWLWAAMAAFWLATLANLTLMNSFLLFAAFSFLFICAAKTPVPQKISQSLPLLFGSAAIVPFVILSLAMKKGGLLYYAQGESFYQAVLVSFSAQFFGSTAWPIPYFWIAWFSAALVPIPFLLKKQPLRENRPPVLFGFMLLGSLLGIVALHLLLGVNFPSDRTGMFLVLYLFLFSMFTADTVYPKAALPIAALFGLHFLAHANFTHSSYWQYEHLPERFWQQIYDEARSGKAPENPTIGGYRIRDLVWSWYNFRHGGPLQNMDYEHYPSDFEDYVIFGPGEYTPHKGIYDSIDADPLSDLVLARRKHFLQTVPFLDSTITDGPEYYFEEFYNLFENLNPHVFAGKSWMWECDLKITSLATPPKLRLVYTMYDKTGQTLEYGVSPLHRLKKEFRAEDKPITVKMIWRNIPPETTRIVVYLWNINREKYTLEKGNIRINRIIQPPG